jgi:hypothetical protein
MNFIFYFFIDAYSGRRAKEIKKFVQVQEKIKKKVYPFP